MIRVADYIAQTLAGHGVRNVFLVTGGGSMHLNDAIGRCKDLSWICCHHEQACAMAAASHYRLTNRLACVNVTTGPGGTNAITGIFGAWVESLGVIVISGQVKFETTVRSTKLPLRQLGDQELDITRLVSPITKYAVMVTDPSTIRFHLEKALDLATEGRPGPVWLDIPMNVQSAMIDPEALEGFVPDAAPSEPERLAALAPAIHEIRERLSRAERPVFFAGSGIRLAGAQKEFLALADRLGFPIVTGFNAHDLVWEDHPLYVGRQGTIGDRAGNFAVQNADFLLVVGCRLTIRQISYNWENFARGAYKVIVDIDPAELEKPTVTPDLPICADAKDFIKALLHSLDSPSPGASAPASPLKGEAKGHGPLPSREPPSPATLRSRQAPLGSEGGRSAVGDGRVRGTGSSPSPGASAPASPVEGEAKGHGPLPGEGEVERQRREGEGAASSPSPLEGEGRGEGTPLPDFSPWLAWCRERKARYPVVLPEYWSDDSRGINPYCFVDALFRNLPDDAIVVTGDGTACITAFQAGALRRGQRLYSDGGNAPMGFDLPGAIGACIGSGRKPVVCLAGDGSIQMNVQELQTIATNRLPITIFVLNNDGYLSIRLTQQNFFADNPIGTDPRSGVGIPNFEKLAEAYGFPYSRLRKHSDLGPVPAQRNGEALGPLPGEGEVERQRREGEGGPSLAALLSSPGPRIVEVFLDPTQPFAPKTSSRRLPDGRMVSAPLEDMFPFLPREEFESNMIVPMLEKS